MSAMRKLWADPNFLSAVAKMQPDGDALSSGGARAASKATPAVAAPSTGGAVVGSMPHVSAAGADGTGGPGAPTNPPPAAPAPAAPAPATPAPRTAPKRAKVPAVKEVKNGKKTNYEINKESFGENYHKVDGQPEPEVKAHAQREVLAAKEFADRPDVDKVLLGEPARKYLGIPQGEKAPDVVALTKDGKLLLAEGKGTDIGKAKAQFESAGQAKGANSIGEQNVVVEKLVEVPDPANPGKMLKSPGHGYRIAEGSDIVEYEPNEGSGKWVPVEVNGKPIHVVIAEPEIPGPVGPGGAGPAGGKVPGGVPAADPNKKAPAAEPQTGGAKLQGAEDFAKSVEELDKKHTAIQEKLDNNPSTEEAAKLQEQSKAVQKELDTKLAQADQYAKEIAADPKLNIKGGTTLKIFEEVRARFGLGEVGVGGLAVSVAGAFFLGLAIKNIYDADTMMDKVEMTIDLGKNLVVGSVEYGLAETVLGGPVAFAVLAFTNALSDGNMDEQERQQREAAYQAALEASERHNIVQFMSEKFPGSAETVEDSDKVYDQKLYDELKKRVDHMKEQQHNQQVRDTGFHDGLIGGTYNKAKVVPEGKNAAQFDPELIKKLDALYGLGYADGTVARPTRLQRARALGADDRKAGKPIHGVEVQNWYAAEVAKWEDMAPISLEVYTAYLAAFTGRG